MGIPTAVTCVQPSHTGDLVVDETKLFMVTPVVYELSCGVLWMPHDHDVVVQVFQGVLHGRNKLTVTAASKRT